MKIAIMQPYFFPYAGYFQLMANVDIFVFLNDVQYVRQSWMNRNKLKTQKYFTVPVQKSSQKTLLNNMKIQHGWVADHLKIFMHYFGKKIKNSHLYENYIAYENYDFLCALNIDSLKYVASKLNIKVEFRLSSDFASDLSGQEKILHICQKLQGKEYYNLPNGIDLYNQNLFKEKGLKLKFIDTAHQEKVSILESIFNETTSNLRF